ncbi:DUF6020 family protein [Bifidobacterium callimiconis]|uniref:Uncharacterized protein n=1 Tax=Bifidobacterium callimiconis TaxID=2306973 RepID=A0A430FC80_9BIFI|nr:DUF6020 family protein [Bifidobacterium callimiconis]RSX50443.1 hypothetical protein D2E23_1466 [Bifidobacterium callimiconis]
MAPTSRTTADHGEPTLLMHPGPHRPAFVSFIALIASLLSCFSLTASYSNARAFRDLPTALTNIATQMSTTSSAAGLALFAVVFVIELLGWCLFMGTGRSAAISAAPIDAPASGNPTNRITSNFLRVPLPQPSRAIRTWAMTTGLAFALSLTIPAHYDAGRHAPPQATPTLPYVAPQYRTIWFHLFMLLRYAGFALLAIAAMTLLLTWATNAMARSAATTHAPVNPASPAGTANPAHPDTTDPAGTTGPSVAQIARNASSIPPRHHVLPGLFQRLSARNIAVTTALIAVCWLPWMILLWPVNIAADTIAQIMWVRSGYVWDPSSRAVDLGSTMNDQHPWLDTVIYGFFDRLGLTMGSERWGLYLLAALQTLAIAAALAVVLTYLGGVLRVPWQYCTAALAFVGLTPLFGRTAMAIVKDTTSMPFFLLLMVLMIEYVRRVRAGKRLGPWLIVGIVVLAVVCAETRKIAMEIIAASFIVFAVALRGRRLLSLSLAVTPVVLVSVITAIVFPLLHVAPGGRQEMISIPLQQTLYVVAKYDGYPSGMKPGDADGTTTTDAGAGPLLSSADRATVDAVNVCTTSQLRRYLLIEPQRNREIGSADTIKDRCYNRNATSGDAARFLLLWARLGVTHIGDYLHAVPWLRDPFTMSSYYDEGWYVRWGWESEHPQRVILPEYRSTDQGAQKSLPQRYGAAIYKTLAHMPGVSFLMSEATYVVFVPLTALALCCLAGAARRRNLVLFTPWALTILTLMLLPGHQTRYTWTLAFGAVIIAAIPLMRLDDVMPPHSTTQRNNTTQRNDDTA